MEQTYSLIAKFQYENKRYFILKTAKNKIIYAIKDGKNLIMDISKEDLEVFNSVFNSLRVDTKKSIDLGVKNIDGKDYRIFYDPEVCLHFWYKIENGKPVKPSHSENCRLNLKYNNIPTVLYDEEDKNELDDSGNQDFVKQTYITRKTKIGKKFIPVLVAADVLFLAYSMGNKVTHYIRNDVYHNNYSYSMIQSAIESNDNLTAEEKSFLYKLEFVFEENHEYMDLDSVIARLQNLEIEYKEESGETDGGGNTVLGRYNTYKDKITIYNASNFEEADLGVFLHEALHVLQASNSNRFLLELSNELTTREVLRRMNEMGLIENSEQFMDNTGNYTKYASGYDSYMPIEYWVAELLTKEQIRQYQFSLDESVIVNALLDIDVGNPKYGESKTQMKARAYTLLDTIDSFRKDDGLHFDNDTYTCIYDKINYYYNKMYKRDINDSLGMELFSNELATYTNEKLDVITGVSDEELSESLHTQEEAVHKTMMELAEVKGDSVADFLGCILAGNSTFLPRTYLSDDHKYTTIYFYNWVDLIDNTVVEVSEDADEMYRGFLDKEKVECDVEVER